MRNLILGFALGGVLGLMFDVPAMVQPRLVKVDQFMADVHALRNQADEMQCTIERLEKKFSWFLGRTGHTPPAGMFQEK